MATPNDPSHPDQPSGQSTREQMPTIAIAEDSDRAAGPARELEVGTSIDRYVLLGKLGSGGMGVVYAAYDPELDRRIALKLLTPKARTDAEGQVRLLREAQALARVSHPNVVHVYDVGTFEHQVYMAMELVSGLTLLEWLRKAHASDASATRGAWRQGLALMLAAGRGLAAAHAASLVHLDFKPANVLVGDDGGVRVLDFGLAREPRATRKPAGALAPISSSHSSGGLLSSQLTEAGTILGTPGYMPPEQLVGQPTDDRTDEFSFCVVLWEVLYGHKPFSGDNREQLQQAVLMGRISEPPREAGVPRWVHRVVLRGLRQRPEDRYPSMNALLLALGRDPARAVRRWVIAGAALAMLGTGAYGYERALEQRAAICSGATDKLEGVWDDPRKRTIEAAFLATNMPFARDTWATVRQRLDEYSDRWASVHVDACEATRVRGEQSESLMDLRMYCLTHKLNEVQALTDLFVAADAELVERAVSATIELSPLDPCSNTRALMAHEPDVVTDSERLSALNVTIARADKLSDAGRSEEALELATAATSEAHEIGARAREAHALQLAAYVQEKLGKIEESERLATRALWLADAAGADDVRVDAWNQLVWLVGHVRGDFERGRWLIRSAMSTLERIGDHPAKRAELLDKQATLLTQQGHYEEAIEKLTRAWRLIEDIDRAYDPMRPAVLGNIGSVYYLMGEYEKALEYYERILLIQEGFLGPMHPDVGVVYGNIANAYQGLGRYDEALEYNNRALEILAGSREVNHPDVAAQLNNRAVVLVAMQRYDAAAKDYERALQIWQIVDDQHPMIGLVINNLGEVHLALGKPRVALEHHLRAQHLLERGLGSSHPYVAHALIGIGVARVELDDPTPAVAVLERALVIFSNTPADPLHVAQGQFALARALIGTGREAERAAQLADNALAAYRDAGDRAARERLEVELWLGSRRDGR